MCKIRLRQLTCSAKEFVVRISFGVHMGARHDLYACFFSPGIIVKTIRPNRQDNRACVRTYIQQWLVGVSSIRNCSPVSHIAYIRRVGKTAQVTGRVNGWPRKRTEEPKTSPGILMAPQHAPQYFMWPLSLTRQNRNFKHKRHII